MSFTILTFYDNGKNYPLIDEDSGKSEWKTLEFAIEAISNDYFRNRCCGEQEKNPIIYQIFMENTPFLSVNLKSDHYFFIEMINALMNAYFSKGGDFEQLEKYFYSTPENVKYSLNRLNIGGWN